MKSLDDLTAQCIRCGFCLESCPTFMETGNEAMSPRGRIHLAKLADQGSISWDDPDFFSSLDSCVGCRACETACPSGVEYGQILELVRQNLPHSTSRAQLIKGMTSGILNTPLSRPLAGRRLPSFVSQAVSGRPPAADFPIPVRRSWKRLPNDLPPVRGTVGLLQGCLMGSLFPSVHEASRRLLRRLGYRVDLVSGCCGALQAHAGLEVEGQAHAAKLLRRRDRYESLIVDSAGCGSHLKDLGWPGVFDVAEFLEKCGLSDLLPGSKGVSMRAVYHEACHLIHGQKVSSAPRKLLQSVPHLELTTLREADVCCGSGGVYNIFQPDMARRLLDRKWANIVAAEPDIVILGNPGCHAWISQAARQASSRIQVMHTVEVLEASFSGMPT